MKSPSEKRKDLSLPATVTIRYFFVSLGTAISCFWGMNMATRLSIAIHKSAPLIQVLIFAIISALVGTALSAIFIRKPLRPFNQILDGLSRISEGDFSVRLNIHGPHMIKAFSSSFNHMASELGSVEMLRNDFVNNFSHEFKTPIVSISGFARMLKRDDLTPEERNEYLDIIIRESDRLAELSTNVLTLSKIENQHILTHKERVNISEQLRLAVALLEKKWRKKNIDVQIDSQEVYVNGNEEMLKQVWINLIDNAIKFSPEYGTVKIEVQQTEDGTIVSVSNEGEISEEAAAHIFDRFYREEPSHTEQGIGLGLTIAQKVIELHGGGITLENTNPGRVVFRTVFSQ